MVINFGIHLPEFVTVNSPPSSPYSRHRPFVGLLSNTYSLRFFIDVVHICMASCFLVLLLHSDKNKETEYCIWLVEKQVTDPSALHS
jgi:hypothetical protein